MVCGQVKSSVVWLGQRTPQYLAARLFCSSVFKLLELRTELHTLTQGNFLQFSHSSSTCFPFLTLLTEVEGTSSVFGGVRISRELVEPDQGKNEPRTLTLLLLLTSAIPEQESHKLHIS